jgi:hypothetical protein
MVMCVLVISPFIKPYPVYSCCLHALASLLYSLERDGSHDHEHRVSLLKLVAFFVDPACCSEHCNLMLVVVYHLFIVLFLPYESLSPAEVRSAFTHFLFL